MTELKQCPSCHQMVPQSRTICPKCNSRFDIEELRAKAAGDAQKNMPIIGLGCLILIGVLAIPLYSCMHESPTEKAELLAKEAADSAKKAEEHRQGLDCLSAWDGSNASFVDEVKRQLRDPDSFQHDETRIAPADKNGQHVATMRYRARNGFGGMNVATAMAVIDGSTCNATVLSIED